MKKKQKTPGMHSWEARRQLQVGARVRRYAWLGSYVYLRWPAVTEGDPAPFHEHVSPELVEVIYGAEGAPSEHLWGPDSDDIAASDWHTVP